MDSHFGLTELLAALPLGEIGVRRRSAHTGSPGLLFRGGATVGGSKVVRNRRANS